MPSKIIDAQARSLAIDVTRSCTVTAPAGSGKTELLTQRFLALLAGVAEPESILAITFTRKAVAEMRQRVMQALQDAAAIEPGSLSEEPPHRQQTLSLALGVLRQNEALGWRLLENPGRLRIRTFDAFAASIVNQLPIEARFGSTPATTDDPSQLYEQAVYKVLEHAGRGDALDDALQMLLLSMDMKVSRAVELLVSLLAKRDQWREAFGQLGGEGGLSALRVTLNKVVGAGLESLHEALKPYEPRLIPLMQFASGNVDNVTEEQERFLRSLECTSLPDTSIESYEQWGLIQEFLLVKSGLKFRSSVTKAIGFPAGKAHAEKKGSMKALLEALEEDPACLAAFGNYSALPSPDSIEKQLPQLEALHLVLRQCLLTLELEFQSQQKVDFPASAIQALAALRDTDDVALKLDYQIHHLLVDEFQDTSQIQHELLSALCREWPTDPSRKRTVFLVGDAMQSIYRFRSAEVGLFMHARAHGLAGLRLDPLHLQCNFRSHFSVVDWVNGLFSQLFPQEDDQFLGASGFKESLAIDQSNVGSQEVKALEFEIDEQGSRRSETQDIVRRLCEIRAREPNATAAVLVRTRSIAMDLVDAFRAAQLPYQAVEFEDLSRQAMIMDLMSLTRFCLNPADGIALFALLRSPLCGLSLEDLLIVGQNSANASWSITADKDLAHRLSADGALRFKHLSASLNSYASARQRKSLTETVGGLWRALGGQLAHQGEFNRGLESTFFRELQALEAEQSNLDEERLALRLSKIKVDSPVMGSNPVQLMTIHKSKGLEFDTVILPGLDKPARAEDSDLLNWQNVLMPDGDQGLMIGFHDRFADDKNSHSFIKQLKARQADQEARRLLYVACTRAAKRLYLYAGFSCKSGAGDSDAGNSDALRERRGFSPRSLAGICWNSLPEPAILLEREDSEASTTHTVHRVLRRLSAGALSELAEDPKAGDRASSNPFTAPEGREHVFERCVGIVVHKYLENYFGPSTSIQPGRAQLEAALRQSGLRHNLSAAIEKVSACIEAVNTDDCNAWIFAETLSDSQRELPLRQLDGLSVKPMIIDRTFVDSNDVRWIVDYKVHDCEQLDDAERRVLKESYKEQLNRYANAFVAEGRNIRRALYLVLQQELLEV